MGRAGAGKARDGVRGMILVLALSACGGSAGSGDRGTADLPAPDVPAADGFDVPSDPGPFDATGDAPPVDAFGDLPADVPPDLPDPSPDLPVAPDAVGDTLDAVAADAFPDLPVAPDAPADASPEVAPPLPAGTLDDPFPVDRFPFVTTATTAGGLHASLDAYDCSAASPESGPEIAWRFHVPGAGTLKVEVLESANVDVDVHVLGDGPTVDGGGLVHGCLARADVATKVAVPAAGTFHVVVDTYGAAGAARPGSFTLAVEFVVEDAWQVVEVAPGVTWRQKVYASLFDGRQTVNVLEVHPSDPRVTVRPWYAGGSCATTSGQGRAAHAVAALNGGFFDPATCTPLGLVQIDGTAWAGNGVAKMSPHATLGLTAADTARIDPCTGCASWPAVRHALGAYPNLVTAGGIDVDPAYPEALFDGRHPRTGVGLRSDGTLLLVTVDGRTDAGAGMTLAEFAQYFLWLGARDAANLDGGGSTTLWVAGQSINGIVNHPSDNEVDDHWGERAVPDGLLVVAE